MTGENSGHIVFYLCFAGCLCILAASVLALAKRRDKNERNFSILRGLELHVVQPWATYAKALVTAGAALWLLGVGILLARQFL